MFTKRFQKNCRYGYHMTTSGRCRLGSEELLSDYVYSEDVPDVGNPVKYSVQDYMF